MRNFTKKTTRLFVRMIGKIRNLNAFQSIRKSIQPNWKNQVCANLIPPTGMYIYRPVYTLAKQLIQITGPGHRYQTPAKQVGGSGGRGGSVDSFVGHIAGAPLLTVLSGITRLAIGVGLTGVSTLLGGAGVSGGGR